MNTKKANIKIILFFSIVIVCIYVIYRLYLFFRNKLPLNFKDMYFSKHIDTDSSSKLTSKEIKKPFDKEFTLSFNILINNSYKNYGYWRHILHKGTTLNYTDILDYTYWENIHQYMPNQCPGIWLHPKKNSLRVAITTMGYSDKEINRSDSHPNMNNLSKIQKLNYEKSNLEYLDIHNIEENINTHFIIEVKNHLVSVYKNGKLLISKHLANEPFFNSKDMHLNFKKNIDGKLSHFYYIPVPIKTNDIQKIYMNSFL
tara:strand:+ start:952 stop:1722 length:771 start_codon:yes stop_codon:yes gene_type:complete